ncbi:MAG: hypothetical protein ABL929_03640 [Ferruginibacter sp.]|nr:hypothetical protein [Ferruginibacter sp.]
MNKIAIGFLTIVIALFSTLNVNAQNLNSTNGGYAKTKKINGKKFRVMYYEYVVNKTPDEVWAEVSGKFTEIGKIAKSVDESHCESGDITKGLGASRFCSINFAGKTVEISEKIIEFTEGVKRKEYTYDVYKSKGFPAKVYNTWVVRVGDDGKTYLGNAFIFRGKPAMMTGMIAHKMKKLKAVRNTVLNYKHYLETGEKKADPAKFDSLYPEM